MTEAQQREAEAWAKVDALSGFIVTVTGPHIDSTYGCEIEDPAPGGVIVTEYGLTRAEAIEAALAAVPAEVRQ
jgi:hypothetical protein